VDVDYEQTKCRAHVEVRRRYAALPLLGCGAAQLPLIEPLFQEKCIPDSLQRCINLESMELLRKKKTIISWQCMQCRW
jgi:hypothetical protein